MPKIVARDLWKAFGSKAVLRGVDLEIRPGESLVVMGSSGSGKSVLLKHIVGLLEPDRGSVRIDGADLTAGGARAWQRARRSIGMSFQEGALFDSMNVFDNVAFPLRRHRRLTSEQIRDRVCECLSLVQLEGIAEKEPSQLSGGMRRRVGFARAIALDPSILLFDEPNTGLDPITSAVIDRVINDLRARLTVTVVTITHDVRSAMRISDRIAMLKDGRIVACESPDVFAQLPDEYIRRFLAGEPVEELEETE